MTAAEHDDWFAELSGRLADGEALPWERIATDPRLDDGQRRALRVLARVCGGSPGTTPTPAAPVPAVGELHAGFELREELGRGSFGWVYRAFDRALQREVALKVLARDHPASEAERARFVREARVLASLDHPNIVRIHSITEERGELLISLEHLEGATLLEWVRERGALSAEEGAAVGLDLCRALAAVHGKGLVHRDVKPANVMRASGGRIVLLDFGMTHASRPSERGPVEPGGTPLLIAPELLTEGAKPSPATDLYALGVTLYYLASGRYPYEAHDVPSLLDRVRGGRPTPLRDRRADLDARYVALVERAIARDPVQRFASAGDFEAALAAWREGKAAPAPVRGTSRRAVALLAGAVLLGAGAIVAAKLLEPTPLRAECQFVLRPAATGDEHLAGVGTTVWSGDELFVELHSDAPAWIYVFQEDLAGGLWKHYPLAGSSDADPTGAVQASTDARAAELARLANPVAAAGFGEWFCFPSPDAGYGLECVPDGADLLLVVASLEPVAAAEALLSDAEPTPIADGAAVPLPGVREITRGAGTSRASAPAEPGRRLTISSFPTLAVLVRELDARMAEDPGLRCWWVALEHRER